jgi:hypothetical protein
VAGPTLEAAPVAVGATALLVAVVPLTGLLALELGKVLGKCGLTGPGPVFIVLRMVKGNEDAGMTEVIVSV